jgi:hypothetical protein
MGELLENVAQAIQNELLTVTDISYFDLDKISQAAIARLDGE